MASSSGIFLFIAFIWDHQISLDLHNTGFSSLSYSSLIFHSFLLLLLCLLVAFICFFFPFYKSSCMSPPTTPYNPQSMIPYFTYFPSSGFFCTKCDTMTMTPDPIDNLYLLLLHSSPVSSPSPQHRHQHYPSQHHHHL